MRTAYATAPAPSYVALGRSGELAARAERLLGLYRACHLCPRECRTNRLNGGRGVCRSGSLATVVSARPQFGSERMLTGRGGSGAIQFGGCNLRCVYCENWELASGGREVSDAQLGRMMWTLQQRGCSNINLTTPTHCIPNIVAALPHAIRLGLHVPLVYNCGGYEPLDALRLLDGIIDVYLPDFKYADPEISRKYSPGAKDYPEVAFAAIEEMYRQVGDLATDRNGIAVRGLLIRHLVLPNNLAGTDKFVQFVANRLSRDTWVNIMAQYHPAHRAHEFPELARPATAAEYAQAVSWARDAGLTRLITDTVV